MTDVLFFHGRESGPLGTKARWLAARYDAFTPSYPSRGAVDEALPVARAAALEHRPRVVVGSSFGGAVAVALALEGVVSCPLVLIAPAAAKLGVRNELPAGARAVLFHGALDAIVPLEDSVALAATGGPGVRLVTVPAGDHPLNALLESGALSEALASFGVLPRAS